MIYYEASGGKIINLVFYYSGFIAVRKKGGSLGLPEKYSKFRCIENENHFYYAAYLPVGRRPICASISLRKLGCVFGIKKHAVMKYRFSLAGIVGCLLILQLGQACVNQDENSTAHSKTLPKQVDFNFHIKPILSDRCFKCHGPDEKTREANLRLDTREGAFAVLDSTEMTYAIVPGNSKKSLLVNRIHTEDPELMMPPPNSNLQLNDYEKKLLTKWIEQGAEWKTHWAFIPPESPEMPKLKATAWPTNAIDRFVLARLEQEGLRPSEEATKEKLIRRLSFDLRGLPPSLAEIDAFLADESPGAYEALVDRFLAEPSYGERLAMEWLDVARYADSHGYQDDLERSMWPWRDWVIEAFNTNMPYDQFVQWQLAGDLWENPSYEQQLATAFNRNHKITQEVGVINEEYRVNYVLDRVNTFSTALLGLTVECAQCHDHKYDPISQEEYYSLFSFFNNVPEKGRVDYGIEVAAPYLPLPPEKVEEQRKYIQQLYERQAAQVQAYAEKKKDWQPQPDNRTADWSKLPFGLAAWYPLDFAEDGKSLEVVSGQTASIVNEMLTVPGRFSGGAEMVGTGYADLAPTKGFNFAQPFSLSFWIQSLDGGIRGPVLMAKDAANKAVFFVQVNNGKNLEIGLVNASNKTRTRLMTKATIPENRWTQVCITYTGQPKASAWKIYFDAQERKEIYIQGDNLSGKPKAVQTLFLGAQKRLEEEKVDFTKASRVTKGLLAGQLDELMLFRQALDSAGVQQLFAFDPIAALAQKTQWSQAERHRLLYQELLHGDPVFQSLTRRLREYRIRQVRTDDIVVKPTMIMQDMDSLRPTYILDRGQYDAPGRQVQAGTPKAVLSFGKELPQNRKGLATWLFSPEHPLTARVAVNRYWQMIFGRGIVATPEDFGSQGALPTHPQLLDWLAMEFQASDWDLKHLLKLMVMSSTYRQSVAVSPALLRKDPENLLLARGPQSRLTAEQIRDHALAISGLLSDKQGGPSVKPYQPQGLWLQVASGNQTLRKYIQDHEEDLYRRSLYTFWKRTIPPPSMTVFDAPSREQCSIQRRNTNTPMQALVLLNDPQFTEAARLLANRMLEEGGTAAADRIKFAFRWATSRTPQQKELDVLLALLAEEQATFTADKAAAERLLSVGEIPLDTGQEVSELAAYTVLASAIFNLTESIQKG
jgi:hypothetical protein